MNGDIPILRTNPCQDAIAARRNARAMSRPVEPPAADPVEAVVIPLSPPPESDVLKALRVICAPDCVYELRMLHTSKGTISGYFDAEHLTEMAKWAEKASGKVEAIYCTLNPCRPDLLARAANRLMEYARHTTEDSEVVRRRWLPLDFDPVRPAGISSTDAEHEAALSRARAAREWLAGQGAPLGLLADSGNGAHLLYRVDWSNDVDSLTRAKKFVERVHVKFNDGVVQVDKKVVNAGRIWKVYSTLARKGDEVLGRKHRMSKILEIGDDRLLS